MTQISLFLTAFEYPLSTCHQGSQSASLHFPLISIFFSTRACSAQSRISCGSILPLWPGADFSILSKESGGEQAQEGYNYHHHLHTEQPGEDSRKYPSGIRIRSWREKAGRKKAEQKRRIQPDRLDCIVPRMRKLCIFRVFSRDDKTRVLLLDWISSLC